MPLDQFYASVFTTFTGEKIMIQSKNIFMILLLLLILPVVVVGQQTSSLLGVISDRNGASIRGADVKLIDTKTAKERITKSNEQGIYAFHKLDPGTGYILTFTAQGFDTLVITNVTVGVGLTETQHAEMPVGQATNTAEITSPGGGTLNTTDASIGNVIDPRRLNELPIQIRESPAALLGLQPGVVGANLGVGPIATNAVATNQRSTNTLGSVTGARADQGNITTDGIDANDQAAGQAFTTVGNAPIDAIQEFRTVSAIPSAAEGRSSGAQILLVTKSGTNQFHGTLREYNRTAATAANSFFNNRTIDPLTGQSIPKPQLTRNQFGGNLGGPVTLPGYKGKDKLFFFFDYEGRRDAQGIPYLRIVPLNLVRNGGLAYRNNAGGISVLSPAQVAALDPQGVGANQALLSFINSRYPQANDPTSGDGINTGGFRFNSPSNISRNTYTTRIDLNATANQKIFGRFNIVRSQATDTLNTVSQQFPLDPESGRIIGRDYSFTGGHTWNISSTIANQVTVGVTRSSVANLAPFAPTSPNIFGTPTSVTGGTFGGAFGIAAPFASIGTQNRQVPVPTIRDDLSWSRGSHDMVFGVSIKPIRLRTGRVNDYNIADLGLGGNLAALNPALRPADILIAPNNIGISNYDSAFSFLLGRYAFIQTNFNYDAAGNAFPLGTGQSRNYRYDEYEAYAQDSWRVRNDLTLSYGVRYHYYASPYEANGFQSGNNANLQALLATRIQNGAAGISGNTAEPFISYFPIGQGNNAPGPYAPDRNNFAPRLNIAWNPSSQNGFMGKILGERKTVIRAGASVVYDRTSGGLTFLQDQFNYLFNNQANTRFGVVNPATGPDPVASLQTDPRFTGTGTLPLQNAAPTITNPATPNVVGGVPIGNAIAQPNYAIGQQFRTPYSIQYSFGFQREMPRNFILEMSYVGRQARKLFSQVDAAQIVDFRDPTSGQFMLAAFNGLQAQLQAGASPATVTPQPWFENQIGPGGTALLARNVSALIQSGSTTTVIQALNAARLLAPNVGMSSQYVANGFVTNFGSSSYNAMLVSLRKRFSQGFQFDFNYSFSHSLDNLSSISNTFQNGLICDFRNLRACRGNSDFDIRHLINVNGIYELPFGRGKSFGGNTRGVLGALIGGWQVGGIYTYRSGLPFNATTGAFPISLGSESAAVLSGNIGALQQQINDAPNGTIQFFGNQQAAVAALSFPQNGSSAGNRNVLRGTGFWNVDTSVLKNFNLPWSESQRLQFRWESFNAFNHNVFNLPNTNFGLSSFGQITSSASSPREMQFALRFMF
jgi:carboxypeptidase family protein